MNSIAEIQSIWKNEESIHKLIAETLAHKTNEVPELKEHRDYVEKNSFGFGERPFVFMHALLVKEMPEKFTFMEIGIYKGAILSLYRMLADLSGKKVIRYGVSPMSVAGDFPESDFEQDVKTIHDQFNLEKDYKIFKGLSTAEKIIRAVDGLKIDILYIDGGHDFATVQSDLNNYLHHITIGGFLVIDDCANDLALPSNYFFGIQSVTDAVLSHPLPNDQFQFIFNVGHNKVYRKK
jgi:hypothetical protein